MMKLKRLGRKRLCPNFKILSGDCLEGLRKTTKNLSQDTRFPGRDLSPEPMEYAAGALTTRLPQRVNLLADWKYTDKIRETISYTEII
jgi:hypothetical protein